MDEKKEKLFQPVAGEEFHIIAPLDSDCGGENFRGMEVKNGKTAAHRMLTRPHPLLLSNEEDWRLAAALFNRIRDLGVPSLLAPERLICHKGDNLLVYPYIHGKPLSRLVEDASAQGKPMPFELAFFIAIAITAYLESGAAIMVKERNAIHGFLTPDNIIIDYNGGIYLKYFGMWPIFEENDTMSSHMIAKYGSWLPPEFIRKERLVKQSDFYHLGYAIYRMLTDHYFTYLPGEDFESTFTSISFSSELPSTDIAFLTTLIHFFKKTLNPVPSKRFGNAKEFKTYILTRFHPHLPEYGEFRQRLADYLRELYGESIGREGEQLSQELTSPPPLSRVAAKGEPEVVISPEPMVFYRKKSRKPLLYAAALIFIIIFSIGGYQLLRQLDKTRQEKEIATKMLEKQEMEKRGFEKKFLTMQQRIDELQNQKPATAEAEQARTDEIARLKEEQDILKRSHTPTASAAQKPAAAQEPVKTAHSPAPSPGNVLKPEKKTTATTPEPLTKESIPATAKTAPVNKPVADPAVPAPGADAPEKKAKTINPAEKDQEKKEDEKQTSPILIANPAELTVKPTPKACASPIFPETMQKTYLGRRATVNAELLIDENGQVAEARIANSDTPAEVNVIILENFKKWTFTPAQKGAVRVRTWWPIKLKIHFKYNR